MPDPHTPFVDSVTHDEAKWGSYSTYELARATRRVLKHYATTAAWLSEDFAIEDLFASEGWKNSYDERGADYGATAAAFVTRHLHDLAAIDMAEASVARRVDLLKVLSHSRDKSRVKRIKALQFVTEHAAHFVGFDAMVARGEEYQLGEAEPWWMPGEWSSVEALRSRLKEHELAEAGFMRVTRQTYLDHVRAPIMRRVLMSDPTRLMHASAAIALYTASEDERADLGQLLDMIRARLAERIFEDLSQRQTPIPMQPLYSMTREMRNIGSFYVSRRDPESIEVSEDGYDFIKGSSRKGRARVKADVDVGDQTVLFFDKDLIRRKKELPDQFIEVQLSEHTPSVLDALILAIEELGVTEPSLEHLPRIVAGMFNAAQRDRRLKWNVEGTYWDTDSGRRLCRIIGFNPDNPRHRQIVQDVREMLSTVILHREARELDAGGYKTIKWKGRMLHRLDETIELEVSDREGLSEHHVYQAWSIAGPLWKMVTPKELGGAPSFMSLDERAFFLDERSSIPFNLYWTLTNRAYMAGLDERGGFTIKLKTLYSWAGLEGRYDRPSRLKPKLRDALDRMIRHDLLRRWECEALLDEVNPSFEKLLEAVLYVEYSSSHLESVKHLMPEGAAENLGNLLPDRD